jgi:hypothetical protein
LKRRHGYSTTSLDIAAICLDCGATQGEASAKLSKCATTNAAASINRAAASKTDVNILEKDAKLVLSS